MRRTWGRMHGLGVVLLTLFGCQAPDTNFKPQLPEEYILPPSDDARFSAPVVYPKETLNAPLKKDTGIQPAGGPARNSRFGGNTPSGLGNY